MDTIRMIQDRRDERATVLETIERMNAELRNIKSRQANVQSITEQDRNDKEHRRILFNIGRANARSVALKDEIKTLNLRHQREVLDLATARRESNHG